MNCLQPTDAYPLEVFRTSMGFYALPIFGYQEHISQFALTPESIRLLAAVQGIP